MYLEHGEALERGGSEFFERQALVLELHASDREGDAGGLAAAGESEVVQYGRHNYSGSGGGAGGGGGVLSCLGLR